MILTRGILCLELSLVNKDKCVGRNSCSFDNLYHALAARLFSAIVKTAGVLTYSLLKGADETSAAH